MVTLLKRGILGVSAAVLLIALANATPAFAESPWWHLTSSSRPTNLGSIEPVSEEQEITTTPGFEEVLWGVGRKLVFPRLRAGETAKEVQTLLDGVYGVGNVEVAGGPLGTTPLVIRTSGAVPPIELFLTHDVNVTIVTPGRDSGQIVVTAANLGDEPVNGEAPHQVKILDKLPPGLTALGIEGVAGKEGKDGPVACSLESLTCTFEHILPPYDQVEVRIRVVMKAGASSSEVNEVSVSGGEGYACNEVGESGKFTDSFCAKEVKEGQQGSFERVSTGPTPGASEGRPLTVSGVPTPFGVEDYELSPEEEGGALDTQAGSHPFQVTGSVTLNQTAASLSPVTGSYEANPAALPKDLNAKLPPGLIGNPTPIPQCTLGQFLTFILEGADLCSPQTAVGVAMITVNEFVHSGVRTYTVPIFNLEPAVGEPARFGFSVLGTPVYLDASVRTGGDYGVTLGSTNISESVGLLAFNLTFWGVPGDPRHDRQRGWGCLETARQRPEVGSCHALEAHRPPPFLALPTSCTGTLQTSIEGDSWAEPKPAGQGLSFPGKPMSAMDGCNRLAFEPSVKITPDGQVASTPTGLNADVHVPQDSILVANGLAESAVKDITVKLPAGVAINPSSGDGLEACSEGLVGFTGFGEFPTELGVSNPLFSSYLPGSTAALAVGDNELLEPGKNFCADASKIGEVTIKTPLLPSNQPVKGFVYLASQEANPFGSVLALYIVAEDPVSGSLVKLPGKVSLCQGAGEVIAGMTCEVAGQLVSTFENTPQLAFEDAELHFFGGERAPLATPSRCGTYTTEAAFTPWSGNPPVRSTSSFQVTSGPNGSRCVYGGEALPFSPSLTGGATNIQAGEFSPFTLTMSRSDGEQNLQSVEAKLPPGLSGVLSNIELCREPQANEGTCGPNSLIGETTVSVGVGGDPFTVRGGKFYLTGPYNGTGSCTVGMPGCAPFGITFEVPAKAGPFDFAKTQRNHPACDCVLVRAKIEINPLTAAITITSNPPGTPDAIPTMLEGIPLEIQHVNAITTRSDFQFNPTNCNKMAVTGTIHSSEGEADTINVPFQVTNCATLKFAPKFAVSTSGKTSKAKGASLSVHLTYPKAPFGSQANIARVKVDLPKQLPSRLTTLQKACTAKQFETNPAGCPSASIIGHAKAITPLIPVPLEGPAYFVSHGGEAFPSLIMVLQGYGVTVDLVGTTFISKAGITSSTFKTVPDAPVGSFELTLPEGKFSALAANGNLCASTTTKTVSKKVKVKVKGHRKTVTRKVKETVASPLQMPTEFVAQNGLKINESTKISVTGCAKSKKAKRAKKTDKGKQGKHGKK